MYCKFKTVRDLGHFCGESTGSNTHAVLVVFL